MKNKGIILLRGATHKSFNVLLASFLVLLLSSCKPEENDNENLYVIKHLDFSTCANVLKEIIERGDESIYVNDILLSKVTRSKLVCKKSNDNTIKFISYVSDSMFSLPQN